jgi:transposase InsO family protein
MGISQAPSYFQQQLATRLLQGYLYNICELYIDDIIPYGKTEDEFVKNVRLIFERVRQYKVKLHPSKVVLGVSTIVVVGHEITKDGITMTDQRVQQLLDMPEPVSVTKLRSFLGMANYFRDHVRNHSLLEKPLREATSGNVAKRQPIKWTEERKTAFNALKKSIAECPKLAYLREGMGEVILQTDASDYGIGAYLFQRMKDPQDGFLKDFPIMFVSKALNKQQLNWSTPEKEAFAIVYAVTKLERYLRDRHFTIQTDHKNLIYINSVTNQKVYRWRLLLQEFDYDIMYIKGSNNEVADCLSRIPETEVVEEDVALAEKDVTKELIMVLREQPIPEGIYGQLADVHNAINGHHGLEKTYRRVQMLRQRLKQPTKIRGLRTYCQMFIKQCPVCQKMKELKPLIESRRFVTSALAPMEVLNIDSITALPEDTQFKYTCILTVVDKFTRWVELYPMQTTSAAEVARCLIVHIGRYGAPKLLQSDQGSEFVNDVIAELARYTGTKQKFNLQYSHEENAIVERCNKEVLRHLRAFVYDSNIIENWNLYLPLVQRIINSTKHERTGVAPASMIFGSMIDLSRNIVITREEVMKELKDKERKDHAIASAKQYDITDEVNEKQIDDNDYDVEELISRRQVQVDNDFNKDQLVHNEGTELLKYDEYVSKYMQTLIKVQERVIEIAQETQKAFQEEHLSSVEAGKKNETVFPDATHVLVKYRESAMGNRPVTKVRTFWKGPMVVVNHVGSEYIVQNLINNKYERYHVSALKIFQYDERFEKPDLIANRDAQLHIVEKILKHTGEGRKVSDYQFLVRWDGEGEEGDTWLPYNLLRRNVELHKYAKNKKLNFLIPKEFKENRG